MNCEKCGDTGIQEGPGQQWYTAAGERMFGWKDPDRVCDCAAGQTLRFDYGPQFGEEES